MFLALVMPVTANGTLRRRRNQVEREKINMFNTNSPYFLKAGYCGNTENQRQSLIHHQARFQLFMSQLLRN